MCSKKQFKSNFNEIYMCGIVGYYGSSKSVLDTLVSGLKRLEYRGYDSAGIAINSDEGVFSLKSVGRIKNLEHAINNKSQPEFSGVGIAHTRWATHGIPNETNAHPHRSSNGKIWVVHNGIIENYKEIKAFLSDKGHTFESQTDTEVIAKLIGHEYKGDLKEAVLRALKQVVGAYALGVISQDEPNRLIGAKKGSPLVFGIGDGEFILASDVSAIISKTRDVIYIEDDELVDLNNGDYEICNLENQVLQKKLERIEWDEKAATKGGFDTFLLKEIFEQPSVIKDAFRGRLLLDQASIKFGGLIDVSDRLKEVDKIVILGIGSSFFAASLGEMFFESLSGITAKAEMSPEFRYKDSHIDEKTWVIAISQSGETADTIGAIQEAKRKGALVTGIVNTVGSTIARITDAGVYNHSGPEISVASTKATTSQYLILLMHAILIGRMSVLGFSEAIEIIKEIEKIPNYIEQVLKSDDEIRQVATKYYQKNNFIYLGRNYNFPIAKEGAIKLKEISYIHAEAFSGGELKHGPIAMIDEDFPTLAIINKDSLYEKQVSSIQEIMARSGMVIALADQNDTQIHETVTDCIFVPRSKSKEIQAIINNVALQLFAYHCAHLRGLDIDKPRNLAKSVTVE
jgi:glucosamine--fructose-6-phosphate aminotransferase (isomerizing)